MATETREEIERRIITDLYPHLADAEALIGEIYRLSTSDATKEDLGTHLLRKEKGKLYFKAGKIDRAAYDCLISHKEDFRKLGIDIEARFSNSV